MSDAHRVIATAGIISVGVGTINSFTKNQTPPSAKFLIGSGAAFLCISAVAEGAPEVGQALALAVMTTILLGEGDGVLSYISGKGEVDTKKKTATAPKRNPNSPILVGTADELGETYVQPQRLDNLVAFPNLTPMSHRHRDSCRCYLCGGLVA